MNIETDKMIQTERVEHNDLIVGDFEDNYENLPIKTFLGYQFLYERCWNKYEFVTFSDDDAFLDLSNITHLTSRMSNERGSVRCIKGDTISMSEAPYFGKYYLWTDLWPVNYVVPEYCNGQCALLNNQAATKIFNEAKRTARHGFRLEDFFYVGILRQRANITDISVPLWHMGGGKMHAFCKHLGNLATPEYFEDLLQLQQNGQLIIKPSG